MRLRSIRLAVLFVIVLLACAPGASAAGVTITGAGRADYVGKGAALMFSDLDIGIGAGPATQLLAPLRKVFPIRCLDGKPLRRCAKVLRTSRTAIRYKLLRPIAFAASLKSARFSITGSPSFGFTIQGCGTLKLRGHGTYSIGSRTIEYRFRVLRNVPIPCGRVKLADTLAALRATA